MESIHKVEIGDTLVISRDFLAAYTSMVAELACEKALERYQIEKSKQEKLSVTEIASQEKCSAPTVIAWINRGLKKGKIKLMADRKSEREYVVSRYDLNEFLKAKKQWNS